MPATSPDIESRMAELRNAPPRVKRVAGYGVLLGVLVFLTFAATAYAGRVGWGRGLFAGALQFMLFWFASISVQGRQRWAWWVLLVLVLLRAWGAFGYTLRIIRVALQDAFDSHGREIISDILGVAILSLCVMLMCLLLSKEVRDYVHKTKT